MIDWDLEAPGLYRFFQDCFTDKIRGRTKEAYLEALPKARGLMEYIGKAAQIYRSAKPAGELDEARADLPEAVGIYDQIRHDFDSLVLPLDDQPNLSLLKAGGEGGDYSDRVRDFNWDDFYKRYGSFFTHLREHLMADYDYILIDSRTGLTDTGGICTRVMPEKMVGVFAPNFQNIIGLASVIRQSAEYRRNARDPRTLVVFPLASRIAAGAEKLRKIWWRGGEVGEDQTFEGYQAVFQNLFKELYQLDECDLGDYFDATQIPHDNDYAFGEKVAARLDVESIDKLSIGTACTNFTERLVRLDAPWESLTAEAKLTEAKRKVEETQTQVFELQSSKVRTQRFSFVFVIISLLAVLASSSSVRSFFSRLVRSLVSPSTNSSPSNTSSSPLGGGNFNGTGAVSTYSQSGDVKIKVTTSAQNSSPENAVDGKEKTAWIVKGSGAEAWIQFDFDRVVVLKNLTIMPGDFAGLDQWDKTNRLASATVAFPVGKSEMLKFADRMEPQTFDMHNVKTNSLRLRIHSVYGVNPVTAVSEVSFDLTPF